MDDASFSKLLTANQQALYDYCRKLTRHKERAEDLAQDVNLRAWSKRELYTEGNFLSWLKTVARHYYLNQVKREALLPIKTLPTFGDANNDELEDYLSREHTKSAKYSHLVEQPNQEDFWLENRIMEVIATLPEHHALLVQKKLQGMTYNQIAKPLGIKANNAKQRYFNVVKELRDELNRLGLLDE